MVANVNKMPIKPSTYSWEVFSKEKVVNDISANRDILAQGLEHAKEFKKPCY